MSTVISDAILASGNFNTQQTIDYDPASLHVTVYQPYDVQQILLPDNANCLAVQALLKMCKVDFKIEHRSNAEYMSPSGRVPFIKCGAFVISEFDNIAAFLAREGRSLSEKLNEQEAADLRAYMSLVNNIFVNAELYSCWIDEETLNTVTKTRHGSVYPWPLNHILNWQKKNEVVKKLTVLGWYNKTIEDIFEEVKTCCTILTNILGDQKYFSGEEEPNELDALVFGHVFTVITTYLPGRKLARVVNSFSKLLNHCARIDAKYFRRAED